MVKEYNYVNILESNIELRNQKVIIYGLSKSALDVYVKLVALGADIVGFTDSLHQLVDFFVIYQFMMLKK